ncbi:DUF5985 family protein [Polyangium mundeleinium]|uniref:DUF5985 family protein n=1 Tax=Polyangium mundeleinium TaxID=2995306 RepID=A0ABT5EH82_9BACT|nr:DUF5985 family protein [Polyangium mundeleinium]MDC0741163.1 DUF5985 family protein [Polyangium mundeleinium]
MIQLLSGVFVGMALAVSLFFLRFWRKSRERLFALLSLVFALLSVERSVLAFVRGDYESRHWIFLVRLLAFAILIAGIVDKNRRQPRRFAVRPR